jgi:hypothetical protein
MAPRLFVLIVLAKTVAIRSEVMMWWERTFVRGRST